MVSVALDTLSFQVPEVLSSFEFSSNTNTLTRPGMAIKAEPRFAFDDFARESAMPIALAASNELRLRETLLVPTNSRNELINRYNSVLASSNDLSKAWCDFLKDTWRCNAFTVEENQGLARLDAIQDRQTWEEDTLKDPVFNPFDFQTALTARFVSENDHQLSQALFAQQSTMLLDFTQNCVQQLLDMVAKFSVGIAQWYPGNNCRYLFFRQKITTTADWLAQNGRAVRGTTKIDIECHDHHLIDAFVCNPQNSPVRIPKRVQEFLSKAPFWLSDHLTLISGTITQESVSEREISTRNWLHLEVLPRFGSDPAICIGSFVLTGWGPRDNDETLPVDGWVTPKEKTAKKTSGSTFSAARKLFSDLLGGD